MLAVIGHVAKKELRQIQRDRRSLVLILVMPIVLTFLFGKALETGDLRQIPSVIVNLDDSPESNVIATRISTYDEVRIQGTATTPEEAGQRLLAPNPRSRKAPSSRSTPPRSAIASLTSRHVLEASSC